MIRSTTRRFAIIPLQAAIAAALFHVVPAQAVEFNFGELEGSFDSQLSVGASWRTEAPDLSLIGQGNGGTAVAGGANNDDGDLNFGKGQTFSKIFKGVHDLQLRYHNYGALLRGKYWYDFELEDEGRAHGHSANGFTAGDPLNDDGFNEYSQFSGAELLDAFVYGEYSLGEMPLDLRLGRQVVSWGESTFIRGGINTINPVDVSAFRRPGAEIKEALLPVNMLFGNLGLTENLSLEAFYQLQFEPTAIDGCGTLFAANDFAANGCDQIIIGPTQADSDALTSGFTVERDSNGIREADDDGQFGLALRYLAESLNDTEIGLYYLNYHSRLPLLGGVTAAAGAPAPFVPGDLFGTNPTYFTTYPEDIQLFGLSMATNVGDWAISGEISHHKDLPIAINGPTFLQAVLSGGTAAGNPVSSLISAAGAGATVDAYLRFDVTQVQASAITTFTDLLGASTTTLVAEVGATHVHNLDPLIPLGRAGTYGTGVAGDDGFVTANSWGYRIRVKSNYNNALGAINLRPGIAFAHDVSGYSPQPGGAFQEGRKALGLSLDADYLNRYTASLSYTRLFGGDYNTTTDKDFIAASIGVSF